MGGEGRLTEEVAPHAAALQRIAPIQALETKVGPVEVPAMGRMPAPALTAPAARLIGEHDMIAVLDTLHALAPPLDHARTLMTQHHGIVGLHPAVAKVYIGMADARGDEAHQDFVLPRAFQLEGFDLQGAPFLAQDGRLNLVHFHVGMIIHPLAPLLPSSSINLVVRVKLYIFHNAHFNQ